MIYNEDSFKRCMFNPLRVSPIRDAYPQLNTIVDQEWIDDNLDRILRYVITMYDPNSPVIKDENDLNQRKGIAADLVGLDEDVRESVFDHTHAYCADLTLKLLTRFVKTKEWAVIVAIEYCFWEGIRKLIEPITGDGSKAQLEAVQKKEALKDGLDKDIKRLESYYKQFFGEDADLEKRLKKKISPEMIAKRV